MIETIQADWIKSEAINLENCCNDNPLKILGPHFYEGEWIIRVWMPEADEVNIIFKNKLVKKISLKLEKLDILKKTKSVGIAVSKTKI